MFEGDGWPKSSDLGSRFRCHTAEAVRSTILLMAESSQLLRPHRRVARFAPGAALPQVLSHFSVKTDRLAIVRAGKLGAGGRGCSAAGISARPDRPGAGPAAHFAAQRAGPVTIHTFSGSLSGGGPPRPDFSVVGYSVRLPINRRSAFESGDAGRNDCDDRPGRPVCGKPESPPWILSVIRAAYVL